MAEEQGIESPEPTEDVSTSELLGIELVPEEKSEQEPKPSEPGVEDRLGRLEEAVLSVAKNAEKFQSLYDKNLSQWSKLQESLGKMEVQEPKVGTEQIKVPDPWDPEYGTWLDSTVDQKVDARLQTTLKQQQAAMNEQMALQNLVTDLESKHGFSKQETQEFIDFWAKPQGDVGTDVLVDVFLRAKGKTSPQQALPKPPVTAGARPSVGPRPRTEGDKLWDAIKRFNEGETGIFGK